MFAFVLASWKPTERSRQWGADLDWAISRARSLKKQIALRLAMDEAHLTRDIQDGRLYGGRVAETPDVEVELLKIRATRYGLEVVEKDLARLLDGIDTLLGKRRAAKMTQAEDEQEEKSA